jgi:hypothetical protein
VARRRAEGCGGICRELDDSRDLVIGIAENRASPLIVHALEGRLSDEDADKLALLRIGLDRIGRTQQKALRAG